MVVYYSASVDGFCDERVFGAKMIAVTDTAALEQAVMAAEALDMAEFDEAQKAAFVAGDDISSVDPLAFTSRVRAAYANPPMKSVPNPDCRLPDDAILIGDDHYRELRADLDQGKILVMGSSGLSTEAPSRSIDDVLQIVRNRRDRMLAKTDWTQAVDTPLSAATKALWKGFRGALRDLPKQIEAMKAADLVLLTSSAGALDELFPSPPA